MAYPLLENPLGNIYFLNGELITSDSSEAESLKTPVNDVTYYETVRIYDGVLLFFEDHLSRLKKSVDAVEKFPVDIKAIRDEVYFFLKNSGFGDLQGNMRIVLTKNTRLYHICEANIPDSDKFSKGINTGILKWERVDPNVKVFRGDYKKAVADAFSLSDENGFPYEILLTDSEDRIYEGSKSNFFACIGNRVYSAPDNKILIGITRNRVLESLSKAGAELCIGTFTLSELKEKDAGLFVSSTPFDILPITYVNGVKFNSVNNDILTKISKMYNKTASDYIESQKKLLGG